MSDQNKTMSRLRLFVSPQGEKWIMHSEHQPPEREYDTKEEAIRAAKDLVASLPEEAFSQIIVKKKDGTFQTEWTYGKDPFPPPG
jgi:hypothetical protein